MKRIAALLLVLCMVFALAACGDSTPDPNVGVYEIVKIKALGMELDPSEIYEGSWFIELKNNGRCTLELNGEKANGKWSLDGTSLTISDSKDEITGYLLDGMILLDNLLDSGMDVYFYNYSYTPAN